MRAMAIAQIVSTRITLVLICLALGCKAGEHECRMEGSFTRTVKIPLDPKVRQTDHIIPRILQPSSRRSTVHNYSNSICTWQLHNSGKKTRHLYLQGVPTPNSSWYKNGTMSEIFLHFRLVSPYPQCPAAPTANRSVKVTNGMRKLVSLQHGAYVNVSLVLNRQISPNLTHITGAVALRIDIIDDGFCARDIPSCHGNCYTITDQAMPLVGQLESVGSLSSDGAAQLAGFSNYSQIEEFVEVNRNSRKPLDLSQPVRLGVFYEYLSGPNQPNGLVFIARNETGHCSLERVTDSNLTWNIKVAASNSGCISLHVDSQSGSPVLRHANCSDPMRALVSFPETPPGGGNSSCKSCTADIAKRLNSCSPSKDSSASNDTELSASLRVVIVLFVHALAAATIAISIYCVVLLHKVRL